MPRILIVGGYGAFGARIAERLAREDDIEIVIAGRSLDKAREAADAFRPRAVASVHHAAIDAEAVTAGDLVRLGTDVVINASGPFQAQDYRLVRACIAANSHYIDLADARGYVTGIAALDIEAKAAGVLAVSGASTVPGLSSAVVKEFEGEFGELESLDLGIAPGNSFDPGEATTASILSYVGKPIPSLNPPNLTMVGWQGLSRHNFPVIGKRWMGYVDLPDLDLFPAAYPRLRSITTRAGVELSVFHLGIWGLSWLVRAGLIRKAERLTRPMLAIKRRFSFLGTNTGGMFVTMLGTDAAGSARRIEWDLVARSGHGPFIPAIASVILAKKLVRGHESRRGATQCYQLFTLTEFLDEVSDLDIRVETTPPH